MTYQIGVLADGTTYVCDVTILCMLGFPSQLWDEQALSVLHSPSMEGGTYNQGNTIHSGARPTSIIIILEQLLYYQHGQATMMGVLLLQKALH